MRPGRVPLSHLILKLSKIEMINCVLDKKLQYKSIDQLTSNQSAMILSHVFPVCLIPFAGEDEDEDKDLLAIYDSNSTYAGTYRTSEVVFNKLIRALNKERNEIYKKEVLSALRDIAPRKIKNADKDLIAVNNGIFNYAEQRLQPFDPDFVFTSKAKVNYVPNAVRPMLTHPDDGTSWDIEDWMADLHDDPELTNLTWQILGAIIRPNVRWNKVALFFSEVGNNGKGTIAEIARNLSGNETHTSISISDFGKDFALEPLLHAAAIIVDENEVGVYLDKAANFKSCITGDVVQINRKFKPAIPYKFSGFQIQCLNGFPKTKDKSTALQRRLLFVPFPKSFTGREKIHIKQDFLRRSDVLEYILWRVLSGMPAYYSLSNPAACQQVLDEFNGSNDPVLRFWCEFSTRFTWDLLPFSFLYELFKSWSKVNNPSGSVPSSQSFNKDLLQIITGSMEWYCDDKDKQIRSANRMLNAEPLIAKYDLLKWYASTYRGVEPHRYCHPQLAVNYRGIQRYTNTQAPAASA